MNASYFLGIDVGSSKTHALIADQTGLCLGFGTAGKGNHETVGYPGLTAVLVQSFNQASQQAGIGPGEIAGAGFGIAGYDWPSELEDHLECIRALGISCPVKVANDAMIGLVAGTTHGWGVNVTAGSGVNARGRGPDGREVRAIGYGSWVGEFGGGIEIVDKALQMVNYARMGRIPPTDLTQLFLMMTGASDLDDMFEGITKHIYPMTSAMAIDIFRAAREGDPAAIETIRWAGEELGWLAIGMIRQLGLEGAEVEVVQSGSVFNGGPMLTEPMKAVVQRHAPKARIIRLEAPPVVGAVLLGMEAAGVDGYAVRELLVQSSREGFEQAY